MISGSVPNGAGLQERGPEEKRALGRYPPVEHGLPEDPYILAPIAEPLTPDGKASERELHALQVLPQFGFALSVARDHAGHSPSCQTFAQEHADVTHPVAGDDELSALVHADVQVADAVGEATRSK